ncbi:hypothetical protein OC861_003370 [Tilletia horrida]|nr:hypothetical protein OC861_003370 [Tilletia horrida]
MHISSASSLFTLFCVAAATTQADVLSSAQLGSRSTRPHRVPKVDPVLLQIQRHKDAPIVCSRFLSMPFYAATSTSVVVKTVTEALPAATTTAQVTITNIAGSNVTVVNTEVDVVSVTPTQFVTVTASSSPSSSPQTAAGRRRASTQTLPEWITDLPSSRASTACSKIVVPRTRIVRKTSITTATAQPTVTVLQTSTVVVTPTITSVTTVQSTETEPAVTSTIVVAPPRPSTIQGRIKLINKADGSLAGYWSQGLGRLGNFAVGRVDQALPVEVPTDGSTFNLAAGPAAWVGNSRYVGGIHPPFYGTDLGSDKPNTYLFAGVVPISAAGVQQASPDTSLELYYPGRALTYESQIWRYNVNTQEISILWTNSDGSTFVPTLSVGAGYLFWTSSPSYYSYTPVQAFLEPL